MYTKVDEPVEVVARFKEGRAEPLAFRWHGRTITDLTVALTHTLKEGRATLSVIAVTDGTSSYELSFNNETFEWRLREIHADG